MQMAKAFERTGHSIVAATPHMVPGTIWMPTVDRICSQVAGLNQSLKDCGQRLEIVVGMEIALDSQIPDLLDNDRLLPLGNASCLLIEPAFQQLPPGYEQILFAIQAKGYSIMLAHPERCAPLAVNPSLFERLIQSGVYLQVNWGSFLGQYGQAVACTARLMARKGWIHCLATDSHHPGGHNPERIMAATATLRKIIGQENLQRLTTDNPLRALNGEPLLPIKFPPAMTEKKPPWWRFW
jgi:protein-tyrosine phosphatase